MQKLSRLFCITNLICGTITANLKIEMFLSCNCIILEQIIHHVHDYYYSRLQFRRLIRHLEKDWAVTGYLIDPDQGSELNMYNLNKIQLGLQLFLYL